MNKYVHMLTLSSALFLSACGMGDLFGGSDTDNRLDGDRLSLYDFEKTLQQGSNTQFGMNGLEDDSIIALPQALKGGVDEDINLITPWANEFWPQMGGYPNHMMKHVAFREGVPQRLWNRDIGSGSSNALPLTASPIIAQGMVFIMDSEARVSALHPITGKIIWNRDIIKTTEDEVVIGGGLAYSGGTLFATNGFNELLAIRPETGDIIWRVNTKTPVRAAPSAVPGRVFVTTLDNRTLAFNAKDGAMLWSHRGLTGEAGLLGAAKPAITRDAVIAVYNSGEVYALQIETGAELWNENLSPLARAAGQAIVSDIRALPIVDQNIVYTTSYNNKMLAIDLRTGKTLWDVPIGAASTPWISGNRIYAIETQGTLVSIDRNNGQIIWQEALPRFEDEDNRKDVITWTGPYLAGSRLMVFGSHGIARSYSPLDAQMIAEWKVKDRVSVPPAIANETLYILGDSGDLSAWR